MKKKEKEIIKRYLPLPDKGLTAEQVRERLKSGLYNKDTSLPAKSTGRIITENVFTLFNLVNMLLALAILLVGSYKNLLFMGVVICNTAIGIFQEIRAKRAVEKLSIISAVKVKALRDGEVAEIGINDIVLDDVILLENGDQIPTDCILIDGECQANESLLTGEPDALVKQTGDMLYSGSYIVGGRCRARAENVGEDNYAAKIMNGAKYVKKTNSEIMTTVKGIIKVISIAIIPIGALFFWGQISIDGTTLEEAVVSTAAALIGMIPEGLVLLTSTVLAVGVIRLSNKNVLAQDMYCIETLARVDVLCLDKTGTITRGDMEVEDLIVLDGFNKEDAETALCALSGALSDKSATLDAIREKYNEPVYFNAAKIFPFSSEKKCSGAEFENHGIYMMGAAEFILEELPPGLKEKISCAAGDRRVLLLANSKEGNNFIPMALIVIKDKIRPNAYETLKYFEEQEVELKIISGDNPQTVSGIAKSAGMKNFDKFIDMSTLKTDEEVREAALIYAVFGRVSPSQKKQLVTALKEKGHTVAMTGDGVNDVLALKESDCSIAMASGSDAARNVSQLVLTDSDFSSMPKVVAEGRRAINNVQRSSSLFLVKTIYSAILVLMLIFLRLQYPLEPIQLSLIGIFTIGIPSFILGLGPNKERVKGKFIRNIIGRPVPAALTIVLNLMLIMVFSNILAWNQDIVSTIAVFSTAFTGFLVLFKVSIPFNAVRTALMAVMLAGFSCAVIFFGSFFSLVPFTLEVILLSLLFMGIALVSFTFVSFLFEKILKRKER